MHRLFFAAQPDADSAAAAIAVAQRARAEHGLTGKLIPAERLHITLHWLQDHPEVPEDLIAAAQVAGRNLDTAPFDVVFDKLQSLGGPGEGRPVVLAGTGLADLRKFQRALAATMTDAGIGRYVRASTSFRPHVTLLYDDKYLPSRAIPPIRWAVRELVLVDSLVGEGRHLVRARWPLTSSQAGFPGW
jgi:2'-5' RNA ligase